MDFNGNDVSGGGGSVPDDIQINSICANTGTFDSLGVGGCGSPDYRLPTGVVDNKYRSGIITSRGSTVSLTGRDAIFEIIYGVGTTTFIRQITLTDGDYAIQDALVLIVDGVNSQLDLDGSTNRISLFINKNGFVVYFYTSGNSPFVSLSTAGGDGWLVLGSLGVSTFPPDTNNVFGALPNYSDTSHDTVWAGYNFDQSGSIYTGDMTITGSLSVNTIISDIEVEDAIITLNKNGFADANTSGVVLNASSNTRFSGLLKNANSDDFYLFANSSTLPTQAGWVPEQTGNLFVNKVESLTGLVTGLPGFTYTLPDARGTDGQILKTDAVGAVSWENNDRIVSPSTLNVVEAGDSQILATYNGTNRIYIDNTFTDILSGDTSYVISTGNDRILISDPTAGGRAELNNTETVIKSPDKDSFLSIVNNNVSINSGVTQILEATPQTTILRGGAPLNPTLTLRGGILTPNISIDGREILRFNVGQTDVGFDNATFRTYINAQITDRIAGVVRNKLDATTLTFSDNTSTNRITYDTNRTQILSPSGDNKFEVSDTLTAGYFNNQTRFSADSNVSKLQSPNGGFFMEVSDTEYKMVEGLDTKISITSNTATYTGGINNESTLRLGGLPIGLTYQYGGVNRIIANSAISFLYAPNATNGFYTDIDEANIRYNNTNRIRVVATETQLRDGADVLRVGVFPTSTVLRSPDTFSEVEVSDSTVKIIVNGNQRIDANPTAVRIGGAYNLPIVAGTEGQHLEVDASGNLQYTLGQVFGSVQANVTSAMTLALQNTYYPLPNATNGLGSGAFTFGALGLMTYTGAYPLFVRVAGHCSVERSSTGGAEVFSFSVLKNGAVSTGIGECRAKFDDTSNFPLEVSFEGVVALVTGDTLQLAIANEDAPATTANVYSYSFIVSKV